MSGKKMKIIRKLAFGEQVPEGRRLTNGSNLPITNKTINRRIKRLYKSFDDDLRQKISRSSVSVFNKEKTSKVD